MLGLLKSGVQVYTYAVDMWALGCVVHEILTAETPFLEPTAAYGTACSGLEPTTQSSYVGSATLAYLPQTDMDVLKGLCDEKIEFPIESLRRSETTDTGIEFVRSLLVANPQSRPSAKDVL